MTEQTPDDKTPGEGERPAPQTPPYVPDRWLRVRAEIERNRRGEHRVPTWVLAAALAVLVGGFVLLAALT
jgi:hypothetical protein